ncbi:polysaccharide deacetylase family protein [Pseudochrobactrum sp. HB0163]|uniref:polysaccharide deacetylase family protein n=1 Tax=Pseudochrobactrum sp. HB0163 TaxID=3450708 RepID=UPI003F6DC7B0
MAVLKPLFWAGYLIAGISAANAADEALLSSKVSQRHLIVEPQLNLAQEKSGKIQVALTLDACSGDVDHRILDVLVEEKIPATLFVTSRWLRRNPAAIGILKAHPDLFEIENHGAEHVPAITILKTMYGIPTAGTPAAIEAEVKGGADKIVEIFGRKPQWYRDATARYSTDAVRQIEAMGYRIAGYSLNGDRGASLPAATVARRIAQARDGDVIISHINQPKRASGAGVAEGILALKKRGVQFRHLRDMQTRAAPNIVGEGAPPSEIARKNR